MTERRALPDRRKKPAPLLSRFTLFGRRQAIRRKDDLAKGGYVDRYSATLFFFLVLIIGLNILDSLFTLMILDAQGWELNPIVRSVIDLYGYEFWIWKFFFVSSCLVLLSPHSKVRRVKVAFVFISLIYLSTVLYQMVLLNYHESP
jgi:hypothetical protein